MPDFFFKLTGSNEFLFSHGEWIWMGLWEWNALNANWLQRRLYGALSSLTTPSRHFEELKLTLVWTLYPQKLLSAAFLSSSLSLALCFSTSYPAGFICVGVKLASPKVPSWAAFSCACVFRYLAHNACDVSQHLLRSLVLITDRASKWAGEQRWYSGAAMCAGLALPTYADIHTFILRASFSVQSEWAAIHSITLHVGENSWKAQACAHLLGMDWCDWDDLLWLVIRGNHQSSDSPCAQKCVWDKIKRMFCVRKQGMRYVCLCESAGKGCCV